MTDQQWEDAGGIRFALWVFTVIFCFLFCWVSYDLWTYRPGGAIDLGPIITIFLIPMVPIFGLFCIIFRFLAGLKGWFSKLHLAGLILMTLFFPAGFVYHLLT